MKGDFEPIISEELWTKCESIRKGKITKFRMPNGEERRKGTQSPRLLWVTKIRCRCGGAYKRFCWRTLANGIKVFGYQCVCGLKIHQDNLLLRIVWNKQITVMQLVFQNGNLN